MTSPLLTLYTKRHDELVSELEGVKPSDASTKIRGVLHQLERPFSDQALSSDADVRIAHHALAILAETVPLMASVSATAEMVSEDAASLPSEGRRIGVRFLWLSVILSFSAAAMSIYVRDLNLDALGFVLLALAAAVGASIAMSRKDSSSSLTKQRPPELHVDARTVHGHLSRALRAADDLVAVAAARSLERAAPGPVLNTKTVLQLLQGLVAHRINPDAEDTVRDLAAQAARVLRSANITSVEYAEDKAELFDDQPAGISETMTLRPALIDGQGRVLMRGTVLVPV